MRPQENRSVDEQDVLAPWCDADPCEPGRLRATIFKSVIGERERAAIAGAPHGALRLEGLNEHAFTHVAGAALADDLVVEAGLIGLGPDAHPGGLAQAIVSHLHPAQRAVGGRSLFDGCEKPLKYMWKLTLVELIGADGNVAE